MCPCECIYMCMWCAGTHEDQERVSDPLDLELQMAVSCWCGCWDLNLVLMTKQRAPLTTESSLQPPAEPSHGFSLPKEYTK